MGEIKDDIGMSEQITIVLRGPDGKIKDKRKIKTEDKDATDSTTGA